MCCTLFIFASSRPCEAEAGLAPSAQRPLQAATVGGSEVCKSPTAPAQAPAESEPVAAQLAAPHALQAGIWIRKRIFLKSFCQVQSERPEALDRAREGRGRAETRSFCPARHLPLFACGRLSGWCEALRRPPPEGGQQAARKEKTVPGCVNCVASEVDTRTQLEECFQEFGEVLEVFIIASQAERRAADRIWERASFD